MAVKVFIDGREGTTGLRIYERFQDRQDVEILTIDPDQRKDPAARRERINASDYTFLCLPDAAAKEAVTLVSNPHTKLIDASTAHRTNPSWVYGFPELSEKFREQIAASSRLAVPGCYASGFLALIYPLIALDIMPPDFPVTCYGISGYSGGGKGMIAGYENEERPHTYDAPRIYTLSQQHKHLPEMQKIASLRYPPLFSPIVDDYYSGMAVSVPIQNRLLPKKPSAAALWEVFREYYAEASLVRVRPFMGESILTDGTISANVLSGKDFMELFICGNAEQTLLTARFDNLGKGASGAAIQCMNIMMGIDEGTGLVTDNS